MPAAKVVRLRKPDEATPGLVQRYEDYLEGRESWRRVKNTAGQWRSRMGWQIFLKAIPPNRNSPSGVYEIAIYDPTGLLTLVPPLPEPKHLRAVLDLCMECRCSLEGDPVLVGFSMRVCRACREKLVPVLERPGWNN